MKEVNAVQCCSVVCGLWSPKRSDEGRQPGPVSEEDVK